MKKLLLPVLLLSVLLAEDNKVNLKIDGMRCAYSLSLIHISEPTRRTPI